MATGERSLSGGRAARGTTLVDDRGPPLANTSHPFDVPLPGIHCSVFTDQVRSGKVRSG